MAPDEILVRCSCCGGLHRYRVLRGPTVSRAVQNSTFGAAAMPHLRLPFLQALLRRPPGPMSVPEPSYRIRATCPATGRSFVVAGLKENVKLEFVSTVGGGEASHG
jgi:hypothetical protein